MPEPTMRTHEKCGGPLTYSKEFDAFFCPACDEWVCADCKDPHCGFCKDRPEKPSMIENEK